MNISAWIHFSRPFCIPSSLPENRVATTIQEIERQLNANEIPLLESAIQLSTIFAIEDVPDIDTLRYAAIDQQEVEARTDKAKQVLAAGKKLVLIPCTQACNIIHAVPGMSQPRSTLVVGSSRMLVQHCQNATNQINKILAENHNRQVLGNLPPDIAAAAARPRR